MSAQRRRTRTSPPKSIWWPRCSGADWPAPGAAQRLSDRTTRVIAVLRHIALLLADEPELAGAVTTALLGKDPDVEHLRQRIGREINTRLTGALGDDGDPAVIETLELMYAGALVRAGMGYNSYQEIAELLEKSARLILT